MRRLPIGQLPAGGEKPSPSMGEGLGGGDAAQRTAIAAWRPPGSRHAASTYWKASIHFESGSEERPEGARREGRTAPTRAVVGRVLILFLITLALAGCGKKGAPQPPADEPNTYPRVYPSA